MIKLHIERNDCFSLLYEMIKSNDITTYTLLDIALNHIPDYEIDNFVKAIVSCKQEVYEVENEN